MISNEHLTECFIDMWNRSRKFIRRIEFPADFSKEVMQDVEPVRAFVDAENIPTIVFKVFMHKGLKNAYGKAHGGAITTLIDILTWNGLFVDPSLWPEDRLPTDKELFKIRNVPSLSRKINVRFARPVDLDKYYYVTVKLEANSRNGAFATARIHDEAGKTYAYGVQDLAKIAKKSKPKERL